MTYYQMNKLMKQFTKVLFMIQEEERASNGVTVTPVFYESMQMTAEDIVRQILELPFNALDAFHRHDVSKGSFHHITGHSLRTALICVSIGRKMRLNSQDLFELGMGGLLHDVGKLAIPSQIIDKPDKLTLEEYEMMKQHSHRGFMILSKKKWLTKTVLTMIHRHHERLDGSGYPLGIHFDKFTIFDKIVGVADVFDAISSARVYRKALSYEVALETIESQSPHQLDETVALALSQLIAENENLKVIEESVQYALSHV